MFLQKIISCLILHLTVVLVACTPTRVPEDEVISVRPEIYEAAGKYRKQYVLVPGDRIEVSVWRVPEVSRVVLVRPDGYISLPTVSGVKAAGLTFDELEKILTERLSVRLRDPNVSIMAVDIRESMVFVLGDVTVQRAVSLHEAETAMEAISMAGGITRSGGSNDVSIIRLGEDGLLRAIPVDAFSDTQPSAFLALSLVRLQPDDIVFVPERNRSEVIRFLDDFIGRPLGFINLIGNTVINYRLLERGNF